MRHALALGALLAVFASQGCATEVAIEGFDDLGMVARETIRTTPTRLERAVRTQDGVYFLVVRYSDDRTRLLRHDPSPQATHAPKRRKPRRIKDSPQDWPEVGTSHEIEFSGETLPPGAPIAIGDGGGAPGLPCLRIKGKYLERCAGQGYARVGELPIEKRKEKTWLTYLAQGAFAIFIVPLAVSFDVAVAAAYVLAHCK